MRSKELGPSQRQLRVGEQVKHVIAQHLQRGSFSDPALYELASQITVSEVRVSPDMKNATAFIMTLGGRNMDEVLPALNEATHEFSKEIGKHIRTKFTPRIKFISDDSYGYAEKIANLIQQANK
ncbi:MAG: 30S ribosome-binding factor RbfA [Alphaproteobacteria bacterium]|nr:30S ribosome-binding factor RbfA [Alphaproteobacteria bacterium]